MFEFLKGFGSKIANIADRVLDRRSAGEKAVMRAEEINRALNSTLPKNISNKLTATSVQVNQQQYPSVKETLASENLSNRSYIPTSIKAPRLTDEIVAGVNPQVVSDYVYSQTEPAKEMEAKDMAPIEKSLDNLQNPLRAEETTSISATQFEINKGYDNKAVEEFYKNPTQEAYLNLTRSAKQIIQKNRDFDHLDIIKILEFICTTNDRTRANDVKDLLSLNKISDLAVVVSDAMLEVYSKLLDIDQYKEIVFRHLFDNTIVYALSVNKVLNLLKAKGLLSEYESIIKQYASLPGRGARNYEIITESIDSLNNLAQENQSLQRGEDTEIPKLDVEPKKIELQENKKEFEKVVKTFDTYLKSALDEDSYVPLTIANPSREIFYNFTIILTHISKNINHQLVKDTYRFDPRKLFVVLNGSVDATEFVSKFYEFLKKIKNLLPTDKHFGVLSKDLDEEKNINLEIVRKAEDSEKWKEAMVDPIQPPKPETREEMFARFEKKFQENKAKRRAMEREKRKRDEDGFNPDVDGLSLDDIDGVFDIEAEDIFRFVRSWKINMRKLLNMDKLDLSLLDEEDAPTLADKNESEEIDPLFEINEEVNRDTLAIVSILRSDDFKTKDIAKQTELISTSLNILVLDIVEGLRDGQKLTQGTINNIKERVHAIPAKYRNANLNLIWMLDNLKPDMNVSDLKIDKKTKIKIKGASIPIFKKEVKKKKPEVESIFRDAEVSSEVIDSSDSEENFFKGADISYEVEDPATQSNSNPSQNKAIVPMSFKQGTLPQGKKEKITVERDPNSLIMPPQSFDEDIRDAEFEEMN